jgi:hypothetical protein
MLLDLCLGVVALLVRMQQIGYILGRTEHLLPRPSVSQTGPRAVCH